MYSLKICYEHGLELSYMCPYYLYENNILSLTPLVTEGGLDFWTQFNSALEHLTIFFHSDACCYFSWTSRFLLIWLLKNLITSELYLRIFKKTNVFNALFLLLKLRHWGRVLRMEAVHDRISVQRKNIKLLRQHGSVHVSCKISIAFSVTTLTVTL